MDTVTKFFSKKEKDAPGVPLGILDLETELEHHYSELDKLCSTLGEGVKEIPNLPAKERASHVRYLQDRLTRVKDVMRSIRLELRHLPVYQAEAYHDKNKMYSDKINKIVQDMIIVQEKSSLMEGSIQDDDEGLENIDKMPTGKMLERANLTQHDSLDRLDNVIVTIESSKQVGGDSLRELSIQNERMERTRGGLDDMKDNLSIGRRELWAFIKRAQSDKLLIALLCLVVFGFVFILIWKAIRPAFA